MGNERDNDIFSDVETFSLEEIIAEVKSAGASQRAPAPSDAPKSTGGRRLAAPEPAREGGVIRFRPNASAESHTAAPVATMLKPEPGHKPDRAEPAREKPPGAVPVKTAPPPPKAEPPEEPPAPRRKPVRRDQQTPWRTVYEEEPEEEETLPPPPRAPKRVKSHAAPPPEEEEPEEPPRPPLDYDFLSRSFDDAAAGTAHATKRAAALSIRVLLLLPLFFVSAYLTLAPTLALPMPPGFTYTQAPFTYVLVLCVCQVLAMMLASESTAAGLYRLVRLRPTLDSLVLFSCLASLAHAVSIIVVPAWGGYLPYSCVSIFTCLCAVLAKRRRALSLKRAYKICQLTAAPVAVKTMGNGRSRIAFKTQRNPYPEASDISLPDETESASAVFAPLFLAACIALAAAASFGRGHRESFLWALAAISSVCAPVSLLLSAATPAATVSKKLFTSGAALVNRHRARELARSGYCVLGDSDLFPAGSVSITGLKVVDGHVMEQVVAQATAVLMECGSGIAKAFLDFSKQQYIAIREAENIRFFETGGASAEVGGDYILIGSASFLMRMGVRVTTGLKVKNGIFVAVNSRFAGVFSVKYSVQPQAFTGFRILRRCRVRPMIALHNFNLTPTLVDDRFELWKGWADYPDADRRDGLLSPESAQTERPLAILSRDSLMVFTEAVAAARQSTRAAVFGLICGLLCATLGMAVMYFLASGLEAASAAPGNVLIYLIMWYVPCMLGGAIITKY